MRNSILITAIFAFVVLAFVGCSFENNVFVVYTSDIKGYLEECG